jgi:hypothetical protein
MGTEVASGNLQYLLFDSYQGTTSVLPMRAAVRSAVPKAPTRNIVERVKEMHFVLSFRLATAPFDSAQGRAAGGSEE